MREILDISSDEEEGLEESLTVIDFNFIREMLFSSDEESDDSVKVVEIRENKPEVKSKSSTLAIKDLGGDDDDDDCVLLESDPENGVASVEEEANGSDELFVIGEKGQIACRDFPHARYLCATLPFSSTPHEKHCKQCHCYVCDSPAPCLKWGTGALSSDHCHAIRGTEPWEGQRKNFKLGLSSSIPASTNFGTSLRPGNLQPNEFVPPGVVNLSPNSVLPNQAPRSTAMCAAPSLNSIPQIQASRPTINHFHTTSLPYSSVQNQVSRPINTPIRTPTPSVAMPNGASHGRLLLRNRVQPPSVPRPVLGVCSHTIQKVRGNGGSSFRPQFLRHPLVSRGVDSAGNFLIANNSLHGSSGFSNSVNLTQHHNYGTSVGFSNYRNCNEPYDACRPTNIYPQLSSQLASLSCVNQQSVASETQAYSQPLPLSNNSQGFHQNCIQVNNGAPYVVHLNSSHYGNEPQIRSQNGNFGRNSTQCGITSQDSCQPQLQQPHEQSARETAGKFSAFDPSWIDNTAQSILETSGPVGQAPNVNEFIEPLFECSQSPNSFVDFDNWLLDKDRFPESTDGVLQSEPNMPSPDLFPADMGMSLFYHDGK
ncbi:uncharacterized protein LOC106772600 [Vigna radiata var. radiata]|uniref:Uncharacterized protein LOC106772600 n=1 Tax=Vigna radiata var. radiata TaxID=3916 RepID=A0A1S3V8R4_VIGRR|nr:uncharacterized protein LOC106772600 [Vigna radiata var. radiata]